MDAEWQDRIERLERQQAGQGTLTAQLDIGTAWIAPTLAANWSNYGSGEEDAGYRQDATGRIWLRGLIKKSVAVVGGETVFTLPAGFRPRRSVNLPGVSNGAFAYIGITSAGAVNIGVGDATWVSLEGLSFATA